MLGVTLRRGRARHRRSGRQRCGSIQTDEQGNCRVVSIKEHYELDPFTLNGHKQVRLGASDTELRYLIVMPLGMEDMSDGESCAAARFDLILCRDQSWCICRRG